MNLTQERKLSTWLFNPFEYIAGGQALGIGVVVLLVTGSLGALSHTHFDGVLDSHTGALAPWWVFIAEGFIDWLSLGVVLWLLGRLVARSSFRAVDLFGTQAMARWPAALIALFTLIPGYRRFSAYLVHALLKPAEKPIINPLDATSFGFVALAMLVLIVWMIALMWKSYSVSCNAKGPGAVISFILGIFLAEVVSKFGVIGLLH